MRSKYAVLSDLAPGLVRITHPVYGATLWTPARVRGRDKPCVHCRAVCVAGKLAWRPITHGLNRAERLCTACVERALPRREATRTA